MIMLSFVETVTFKRRCENSFHEPGKGRCRVVDSLQRWALRKHFDDMRPRIVGGAKKAAHHILYTAKSECFAAQSGKGLASSHSSSSSCRNLGTSCGRFAITFQNHMKGATGSWSWPESDVSKICSIFSSIPSVPTYGKSWK